MPRANFAAWLAERRCKGTVSFSVEGLRLQCMLFCLCWHSISLFSTTFHDHLPDMALVIADCYCVHLNTILLRRDGNLSAADLRSATDSVPRTCSEIGSAPGFAANTFHCMGFGRTWRATKFGSAVSLLVGKACRGGSRFQLFDPDATQHYPPPVRLPGAVQCYR